MEKFCRDCGRAINEKAEICPNCGVRQMALDEGKNHIVAGILALILGGFGIHKFYMGKIGWGIVYLLFFWTVIPAIAGLIEGIIYLLDSPEKFAARLG